MPLATTPLGSLVEQHRDRIVALAKEHRGRSIAVFGSVARGEDGPASDIDFLVEFEPGASLFDLMRLEDDLRDLLCRRVDVVSAGALVDRDDEIRRDAVVL
jgi:predicted nucleotidyltransferase